MESNVSDLVVGLMMALFGLVGLFLVAGAADDEMYLFGLSLSAFAVLFDLGLIRRYYDRRDLALAAVRDVAPAAVLDVAPIAIFEVAPAAVREEAHV